MFVATAAAEAKEVLAAKGDVTRAMELRRRAKSSAASIDRLHHRTDPVVRGALFQSIVSSDRSRFESFGGSNRCIRLDRFQSTSCDCVLSSSYLFPLTSPLILPVNKQRSSSSSQMSVVFAFALHC